MGEMDGTFEDTPCRFWYSSSVSSNLSTFETSVNWPVRELLFVSATYKDQINPT